MSRLRIASLSSNLHIGGDGNRLLNFARSLDRSRFDHRVVALTRPSEAWDAQLGSLAERLAEHDVPVEFLGEPYRSERTHGRSRARSLYDDVGTAVRVTRRLARRFRELRVDVVDARMGSAILFGVVAGRLARVPVVVATEYGPYEAWQGRARSALGQVVFSRLDALICDSDAHGENFRRWLARPPRIEVIRNGIHVPEASCTRAEMLGELGLPDDDDVTVFGQVSRLVRPKGQGILLDAFARVHREHPRSALVICGYPGDPAFRKELDERSEALGLGDCARIVSHPGPIGDVWQAIDVEVHASWLDSSPIAIHEGMALGRPAVVTDCGGIPELVTHGETGWVVPSGDAGALADGMLRLARDPALARKLGDAARARYEARHRPEVMAGAICGLFESLVSEARA